MWTVWMGEWAGCLSIRQQQPIGTCERQLSCAEQSSNRALLSSQTAPRTALPCMLHISLTEHNLGGWTTVHLRQRVVVHGPRHHHVIRDLSPATHRNATVAWLSFSSLTSSLTSTDFVDE